MRPVLPRILASLLLAGALVGTTVLPAFADPRNFTVVNGSSSVVITHLYVAPATQTSWDDDWLGRDALIPGESWDLTFGKYDAGTCLYDIKVLGKDGEVGYIYGADLCTLTTVTFS